MHRSHQIRVGIIAPPLPSYIRDIYRGILHFARRKGNWLMRAFSSANTLSAGNPRDLAVDGLIAHVGDSEMANDIRALHVPCVNLSSTRNDLGFPCVWPDNRRIGSMAAEHLVGLGLRNFAYLGYGGAHFARLRSDGFRNVIQMHGFNVIETFGTVDPNRSIVNAAWLTRWLGRLPLPCGVFTCGDDVGAAVLTACSQAKLRVPEDIAVVGVNDEETLCPFTVPPLSSVPQPGYQIGCQAAALLDEILRGRPLPAIPVIVDVPPLKPRQSTDVVAAGDSLVASAVAFIREHARTRPITAADVANALGTPRRTLDRRFMKALGWSPKHEIDRMRLARLQWYLAETDVSIKQIWIEMGFSSTKEPARFLRRHTGMMPTEYRRTHSRS